MSDITANREAQLKECIEELYATFGGYRLPEGWREQLCDPKFTKEEILRSTPLRKLTGADLTPYHWKAMTTWGTEEDFKHFVPRLLELIVPRVVPIESDMASELEPCMVSNKLRYGRWSSWPEREREAIHRFYLALWSALLASDSKVLAAPRVWLSIIAHAEDSIAEFLEIWDSDLHDEELAYVATTHLATSVGVYDWPAISCHKVLEDYYAKLDAQNAEAVEWILSDRIFQLMEDAFFRWQDTPEAEHFSQAHHWLALLRQERRWKRSVADL
ncbi:hypothetical protein NG895_11360 [Aeoliella sp. ICT_H6.2]|uniref:Uncharacterized protein n=1 Tax=Aeoliella straminimaris TaxID=2954799 RepID=A0A9X2JHC8_9BACT|nr:hypothetical protein [Aeoliella straminimaris]MCO6044503.1 hypothetical protein [Aeoliella straminimaris]